MRFPLFNPIVQKLISKEIAFILFYSKTEMTISTYMIWNNATRNICNLLKWTKLKTVNKIMSVVSYSITLTILQVIC